MIQWYDERPLNPYAAFLYFECLFRNEFLNSESGDEGKYQYVLRLSVALRELELSVLPRWSELAATYEINNFSDALYEEFEADVKCIIPELEREVTDPECWKTQWG